jgi:hypothetical protein
MGWEAKCLPFSESLPQRLDRWRALLANRLRGMSEVRLPEVRQAALGYVAVLAEQAEDELLFDDAVEEVWHLLDPVHSREPGDILASMDELLLAAELWQAIERAQFPLPAATRAADPVWVEVSEAAQAFLAEAGGRPDVAA